MTVSEGNSDWCDLEHQAIKYSLHYDFDWAILTHDCFDLNQPIVDLAVCLVQLSF